MDTTVFDVVHLFSEQGISAVPIIDNDGIVVNLYETVDVIVSRVSVTSNSERCSSVCRSSFESIYRLTIEMIFFTLASIYR
jgi:predicted transcriptional regulator